MNPSVAIAHYPHDQNRRRWLANLLLELRTVPWEAQVVSDDERQGAWATNLRAWLAFPEDATHHLVLQDDHLPCRDFFEGAALISRLLPNSVVSFYSQRLDLLRCRDEGKRWFVNSDGVMSGAVMMPVHFWREAAEWQDANVREEYPYDDGRLALFLRAYGIRVWNTAPTLIQHLGAQASLVGHDNPHNVSPYFAGDRSALSFDWEADLHHWVAGSSRQNWEAEAKRALK